LCRLEWKEVIRARGHENISATHGTTLEITKEASLSKRGNCIIAVGANKASIDFSSEFRKNLRKDHARITVLVEAGGVTETVNASGNSRMILAHPTDIVVRKGGYICNRTLAIRADKSACDLSRELVKRLKNSKQDVTITLTVEI
jgi:hypothetical protein